MAHRLTHETEDLGGGEPWAKPAGPAMEWPEARSTGGWMMLFVCSVTESSPTLCYPWTAACQASLSFTISQFAQTHVH